MDLNNLAMTLREMRLLGMADALEQQMSTGVWVELPFEDRLSSLVESETNRRKNRRIANILRTSHLRYQAAPEDIDYSPSRSLDKSVVLSLVRCEWVESGKTNLLITGATGTGKTWLACAFCMAAARKQLTIGYHRIGGMLEELDMARHDGERRKKQDALRKLDLLVLDDMGIDKLSHNGVVDLLTVLDDRVGRKSTIVAAQMPVKRWHEYLGGGAEADAIMDRLVHSSRTIELEGESLRAKHRPEF
jgi:DNA replication protein DnaC